MRRGMASITKSELLVFDAKGAILYNQITSNKLNGTTLKRMPGYWVTATLNNDVELESKRRSLAVSASTTCEVAVSPSMRSDSVTVGAEECEIVSVPPPCSGEKRALAVRCNIHCFCKVQR